MLKRAENQLIFLIKMIILGKEEVKNLSDLLLSQKDFDKVQNIHRNWYFFSIKALLAQMAKELLATASCGEFVILDVL